MCISRSYLSSEPKHRKSKIQTEQKKQSNLNKSKCVAKSDGKATTKCISFQTFPYFKCFRIVFRKIIVLEFDPFKGYVILVHGFVDLTFIYVQILVR